MTTTSIWGNRFIIAAIVQGAIITGLTLLTVAIQLLFSSAINIIQFLSLSFQGSSAVTKLTSNPAVMVQFIPPISAFAGLLSIGVIAGDITYIATYLQKNKS